MHTMEIFCASTLGSQLAWLPLQCYRSQEQWKAAAHAYHHFVKVLNRNSYFLKAAEGTFSTNPHSSWADVASNWSLIQGSSATPALPRVTKVIFMSSTQMPEPVGIGAVSWPNASEGRKIHTSLHPLSFKVKKLPRQSLESVKKGDRHLFACSWWEAPAAFCNAALRSFLTVRHWRCCNLEIHFCLLIDLSSFKGTRPFFVKSSAFHHTCICHSAFLCVTDHCGDLVDSRVLIT